jgi:hypothetical protein
MRSILFSLTLVFFTGCLTEAATPDSTDDLDDVTAVAVDPDATPTRTDGDQPSRPDPREAADRELKLKLVQQGADWQIAHDHPVRPDYTPEEPDCIRVAGKPLDPRCKHAH